jgi:hypothetical protein
MPTLPNSNTVIGTAPSVDNNIPINEVNIIKATTLGLQSSK